MTYASIQERQHIADVNAGEACAAALAVRLADLELSPLADALKALLTTAQNVMESHTASEDEKTLAEKLLDAHGDPDDIWTIRDVVA